MLITWWDIDKELVTGYPNLTPAKIDRMTLSEIALLREALHEKYEAESGKKRIPSQGDVAAYMKWIRSLTPLELIDLAIEGRL